MKVIGAFLVCLLAGISPAVAGDDMTTIAVVRVGDQPSQGRWVTTANGQRCVLKGALALAVARDTEVFTVGGSPVRRALQPTWIRARMAEWISFGARHQKRLRTNETVKVIAARTDPVSTQREFLVARGKDRLWVADYKLVFAPPLAPIEAARVAGRVELLSGRLHLLTQRHGRLALLGSPKWLLRTHVGEFVEGEGLVLRSAKKLLLNELDGETIEQTEVFPKANRTDGGMPRAGGERVRLVGRVPEARLLRLRFNWPEQGEGVAFIPADRVSIGKPWTEYTGALKRLGADYSIMTSCGPKLLDPGSFNDSLAVIVESYVGRTITVGGVLDSLGALHVRSLSAHTRSLSLSNEPSPAKPVRITGVTLDDKKRLAYVVTTPDGRARVLSPLAVRLTESKALGATATLEQLR